MAWRVEWTEIAWRDLEQVYEYIAKDSPRYAAAFTRKARQAARSLAQFPNRGRVVPELEDPSIREIYVGPYRLMYRVGTEHVYILGFIHGARNLGPRGTQERST